METTVPDGYNIHNQKPFAVMQGAFLATYVRYVATHVKDPFEECDSVLSFFCKKAAVTNCKEDVNELDIS